MNKIRTKIIDLKSDCLLNKSILENRYGKENIQSLVDLKMNELTVWMEGSKAIIHLDTGLIEVKYQYNYRLGGTIKEELLPLIDEAMYELLDLN